MERRGVYVNLDIDWYNKLEAFADEVGFSKSQALRKIIKIFFEEGENGNYKKHREAGRAADKKN